MGFYGNSYHYTAESFARVVLKNSGIKRYITIPNDDFKFLTEGETIRLDAQQRDSGLGIQSGNHWIKLACNNDSFQVWHDKPGEIDKTVFLMTKDDDPPEGAILPENVLDFNDVLKIAVVNYDAAGHIAETKSSTYYQLPPNPIRPLEIRMNKIDGLDGEPEGGSLQNQLRKEMNTNLVTIQGIEQSINTTAQELNSNLSNLNTAVSNAATALQKAQSAETSAALAVSTFADLNNRITQLEAKVK